MKLYSRVFRTRDYFLYDLDSAKLEGFRLAGDLYQPIRPDAQGRLRSEVLGLDLGLWQGTVEGEETAWARLFTPEGGLIPHRGRGGEQAGRGGQAEVARLRLFCRSSREIQIATPSARLSRRLGWTAAISLSRRSFAMSDVRIGVVGGSRPVPDGGPGGPRGAADRDALRRSFRRLHHRRARRAADRLPAPPRPRPPPDADRAQLPRQHLRLQGPGRRAAHLGLRRGLAEARIQADRHRRARPVLRPHPAPAGHVLRQRPGGPRLARQAGLPAADRSVRRGGPRRPAPRPTGAASTSTWKGPQFSTRAESETYRQPRLRRHRHDQPSPRRGSPARPRSATPRSPWSPTTTAGTRPRRPCPAKR